MHIHMNIYSKTSLNRPTMGPTLSGQFREVVGLGSQDIYIWDLNEAIDI